MITGGDTSTVQLRLKVPVSSIFPLALQPTTAMRFSTPISLLALAALVAADEASDVISLTAQTFQSTVDAEPLALVEFFAPWYGLITFEHFHSSPIRTGVDIAKL